MRNGENPVFLNPASFAHNDVPHLYILHSEPGIGTGMTVGANADKTVWARLTILFVAAESELEKTEESAHSSPGWRQLPPSSDSGLWDWEVGMPSFRKENLSVERPDD